MGRSATKHGCCANARTGRPAGAEINRAIESNTARDRRRTFSSEGSAVDLSCSSAAAAHLGVAKVLRNMKAIREAVILMAGSGSRLRNAQSDLPKPLTPVLGRPLISYTLDALASAGITKINIVVGYESDRLSAAVAELAPSNVTLSFVLNPEWQKQNGISLLAAAKNITSNFLLTMSDHLFDNVIVDLLMESVVPSDLNLTVDRKINSIFDLDDAMKVQTQGGRVVAIGKELPNYDAIDTGLFVCPIEIFTYLERAKEN